MNALLYIHVNMGWTNLGMIETTLIVKPYTVKESEGPCEDSEVLRPSANNHLGLTTAALSR